MPSLVALPALLYGQIITDLTMRFARAIRTAHIDGRGRAQPGGGRGSRKEAPAPERMSTEEEAQPQSSIQHNTLHHAGWTQKDVHTTRSLVREAEKCIVHFRKIKIKKIFPSKYK